MIDREVVYERNLTGSYMKIAVAGNAKFDEQMLLRKKLKGLLAVEQCFFNGSPWYWYNISGKQSLDTYCRIQNVGMALIERMIISICDEIEILEWNLLDQRCLILDPEYIFINNVNGEIIFTVYPGNREDISRQFRQLMEYLLTKLNHEDLDGVRTAYAIYEKSLDEAYSLMDLRDILLVGKRERIQKEISSQPPETEEKKEIECHDTDIKAENKDKTGTKQIFDELIGILMAWKANILEVVQDIPLPTGKGVYKSRKTESGKGKGVYKSSQTESQKDKGVYKSRWTESQNGTAGKPTPGIVYPEDKPQEEPKPQIHPTICISSYQAHPQGVLLYEGTEAMDNIELKKENVRVGKSPEAEIWISKDTISQYHARIDCEDEEYYLEDLNSTNGTFINEEPLAYKERRKLEVDDIVRFADVRFRFL